MANDTFMNEQPDVVEAFTRAIYKAQIWVKDHTAEEIATVISLQFPDSDVETLTTIIDRYKAQDTWTETPIFSEYGFNHIQDIMQQSGQLSKKVPFTDLVRNDFANKVMTE